MKVKVRLKQGQSPIGNNYWGISPGQTEIIEESRVDERMEIVERLGGDKKSKEPKQQAKVTGEKFKDELQALHGIGPAYAEDIMAIASSKEALAKLDRETLLEKLPDDIVPVIEDYVKN